MPELNVPIENYVSLLNASEARIIGRTLSARIQHNPAQIIVTCEESDWSEGGVCQVNMFLGEGYLSDMRVEKITATYDNAFVPLPTKRDMAEAESTFRAGQMIFFPLCNEGIYDLRVIATCAPEMATVSISVEMEKHPLDACRRAFLDAQNDVEKAIRRTRCAGQLIQAFRTTPQNEGFIDRSIKELYASIGKI